jgi:23S rRNA (guanosine2251-2'-O)-methyltransferase
MSASDIFIKNPHSILACLQHRPKDVLELSLPRDSTDGVWDDIIAVAGEHSIRMREGGHGSRADFARQTSTPSKNPPPRMSRTRSGRHEVAPSRIDTTPGGRESTHGAMIRSKEPNTLEEVFADVDPNEPGIWLALDQLQDPQNLGAIFRSAAFFGCRGIICTTERSVPMTPTVYDIATGGVEEVPFVPVINLQRAFESAKESGLWILGTSEHAKTKLSKVQRDRPWLIVVGNEEKGIRRLTEETCDMICAIAPRSQGVTSLNVSVATGILLSHLG